MRTMAALLVFLFVGLSCCDAQIDPTHAQNVTVYHLNPATAGALPVNMDTGDARGDLYFYLGQFLLPLECANASKAFRAKFDCDNPERFGSDLVVTKVDMEIDSRTTKYSGCNLCNGIDPFTYQPCEVGTYVCDCLSGESGVCDSIKVGSESITEQFSPYNPPASCSAALSKTCGASKGDEHQCGMCLYLNNATLKDAGCDMQRYYEFCDSSCNATSPAWGCWAENIPRKTAGYWYSTLAEGMCNESSPVGTCGWKVLSATTVPDRCLKDKLITTVESSSPDCFNSCGPRDTNSSCWITCFFDAVLGEDARHSKTKPLAGLPIEELAKSWEDAFKPHEKGGCATVDVPPSWVYAHTSARTIVV